MKRGDGERRGEKLSKVVRSRLTKQNLKETREVKSGNRPNGLGDTEKIRQRCQILMEKRSKRPW